MDNCAQCHIPFEREQFFSDFVANQKSKNRNSQIYNLRKVINNEDHIFLKLDTLNDEEIFSLHVFIRTSKKSGVVN